VKVTVYGNTAIATGAWAWKVIDGDGTKIGRAERWNDTWVRMPGGKWQCVASQQTSTLKKLTREVTGMRAACIGKPTTC